jgi:hypothetical protein
VADRELHSAHHIRGDEFFIVRVQGDKGKLCE